RSDLYACGVVLFELLTARLPFTGETEFTVKKQHVDASPDLSQLPADVPPGLSAVIETALAKAPEARFESASAMATAVRGAEHAPSASVAQVPKSQRDTPSTPETPSSPMDPPTQVSEPSIDYETDPSTGGPDTSSLSQALTSRPGLPLVAWGMAACVVALIGVAIALDASDDDASEANRAEVAAEVIAYPRCNTGGDCADNEDCIDNTCVSMGEEPEEFEEAEDPATHTVAVYDSSDPGLWLNSKPMSCKGGRCVNICWIDDRTRIVLNETHPKKSWSHVTVLDDDTCEDVKQMRVAKKRHRKKNRKKDFRCCTSGDEGWAFSGSDLSNLTELDGGK
ncbi:MAG: hypothetical protein QF464_20725, partial [Myxococcota bacterium]|nr:hypothetical protein [Myxococcota bacterium]